MSQKPESPWCEFCQCQAILAHPTAGPSVMGSVARQRMAEFELRECTCTSLSPIGRMTGYERGLLEEERA